MSGELFISQEAFDYYRGQTGAPEQGDMLFNGGGEIGKTHLLKTNAQVYVQGGAVLYVRTSESEDLDGEYLIAAFQSNGIRRYVDIASAGGTMKHFTLGPAQQTPVAAPKLGEQKKIGGLFSHLDNLITLHQRKHDQLATPVNQKWDFRGKLVSSTTSESTRPHPKKRNRPEALSL